MLSWGLNTGELVLSEAGPERVPWADTAPCPWGCLLPGAQQDGPRLGYHVNSCAAGHSEEGALGHRSEPDSAGRAPGREQKTGAGEDQLLQGTRHPVFSWTAGSGLMHYL